MIYCKKCELTRYLGLSTAMDTAIRFLLSTDAADYSMGRNEIAGEDVYANRFDYRTQIAEHRLFETHARYADLHILLGGQETIYVAPEASLQEAERRDADDYVGSDGAWHSACKMTPDDALIVFPGEAHKVKCILEAPSEVNKLVVKIRMQGDTP